MRRVPVLLLGVLLVALTGCSGTRPPNRPTERSEPQVVQDVIDATFSVPGPEMLRAMRIQEFDRNLGIVKCGGKSGPINGTSDRIDQARYPDLTLIRDRGFVEQAGVKSDDSRVAGLDKGCNLFPPLPSFQAWFVLDQPWRDVVDGVENGAAVETLKEPMATCLVDRTGLKVDPDDPTSFLRAVNLASATDASDAELKAYATAYADCGEPYFAKVRSLLLEKRPAFVERNRELIEKFASELVAAGYAP